MSALDPRLVALYDLDNPSRADHDHYRALADRLTARTIVDLGCGTGLLTVALARPGRRVIGVDPDAGMLDFARRRPGGDPVEWILGDSRAIGRVNADLVLMSGNVAQEITGDDWRRTLSDIAAALRVRGTLAFESRNPAARAWTGWNRADTYRTRDTAAGPLTEWLDVSTVTADATVTFLAHNIFKRPGECLRYPVTLAFRDPARIVADLAAAGFPAATIAGGWHGERLADHSRVLVVEAQRSSG